MENIARNKKVLASLGLSGAKRELSHAISTKKPRIATLGVQQIKRKPRQKKPKLPPRRSLRVMGKDSDGKELPSNFKEPSKFGRSNGDDVKEEKMSIQGNVEVDEDGKTFLQSLRLAYNNKASSSPSSSVGNGTTNNSNDIDGKRRSSRIKKNIKVDINSPDYHGSKNQNIFSVD